MSRNINPSPYNAYDFFVYQVDVSNLLANTSQSASFTIQQEADFVLTKLAVSADVAGAPQTFSDQVIPLVSLMINDTGSGRNLMTTAVPLPCLFGSSGLPFILPRQRIFVGSSVVNLTLTNYSAATAYNLKLSFVGEKAFRFGGK